MHDLKTVSGDSAIAQAPAVAGWLPAGSPGEPDPVKDSSPKDKRAAQIARLIEDDIVAAGWPIGTVLGSEAELIQRYAVSRAVFREAVRLVEHHQVAVMRRGPSGGLVVKAPDAAAAATSTIVYLEFIGSSVQDLFEARLLLEPLAAAAAARNITEEGIETLRLAVDEENQLDGDRYLSPADGRLHVTLAELSGNPALHLFVDVLVRLTERYARVRRATKAERAEVARQVDHVHRALADAIVASDAAAAQHYMMRHIEASGEWLSGSGQRMLRPRGAGAAADGEVTGHKLAEVTAAEIRADINRGGWKIGDVIGSETALLERYGVSRAILREAVRILEHHSVVRMRRGPGGGLLVTVPEPDAGIEAMALYLDYRGATVDDLLAVRKALELGALDKVVDRSDDPEVPTQLRATLKVGPTTPLEDARTLSHELHLTLGDLGANPVVAFFLRTITSLWIRHNSSASADLLLPPDETGAAVQRAHRAIVDAILAGDHGLARHRMTRHLDALPAWWH
jgi:DNA-binding FadR family transcriptional regulator